MYIDLGIKVTKNFDIGSIGRKKSGREPLPRRQRKA